MDNCNYNLNSSFTRFGANDTTNCQLKIDKVTFNRYKDTLTQKQIYANIAKRTVRNFSVCKPEESTGDGDGEGDGEGEGEGDGDTPPGTPQLPLSPPDSPTPPDNDILIENSNYARESVSVSHPDQIPEVEVEKNYPSCSYKPIKF